MSLCATRKRPLLGSARAARAGSARAARAARPTRNLSCKQHAVRDDGGDASGQLVGEATRTRRAQREGEGAGYADVDAHVQASRYTTATPRRRIDKHPKKPTKTIIKPLKTFYYLQKTFRTHSKHIQNNIQQNIQNTFKKTCNKIAKNLQQTYKKPSTHLQKTFRKQSNKTKKPFNKP